LKCGELKRRLQVAQVRGDGLYEHLNWFYSAGYYGSSAWSNDKGSGV